MAAPVGPPPLDSMPRIPDLHGLDAFQPAIPQSLPNLPAPIQNVETRDEYVSFFCFCFKDVCDFFQKKLMSNLLICTEVFGFFGCNSRAQHRNVGERSEW